MSAPDEKFEADLGRLVEFAPPPAAAARAQEYSTKFAATPTVSYILMFVWWQVMTDETGLMIA